MQRDRDKKLKWNTTICQILGIKCAEENAFADFPSSLLCQLYNSAKRKTASLHGSQRDILALTFPLL